MSDKDRKRREIGQRIRQLRVIRGFTLQELADGAKMSAGYLSEIERGGPALSGEKLEGLAGALSTNVEYILTGTSASDEDNAIRIPAGLAEAAEMLDLSYAKTRRLLAGKKSLVAARRDTCEDEWTAQDWIEFYKKVEHYL